MRNRETRMGNRTAKFLSALVGSIIAAAPYAAVSQNAPSPPAAASAVTAAGDCLASPKGTAPQGQHWHYRVERGTKRQCWYMRAEGGKAATTTQSAQATADTPAAAPAAPQSLQNAHAEYIAPQANAASSTPAPAAASPQQAPAATDANAAQPAVATRWPDTTPQASPGPQPGPTATSAPATASAQSEAQPATTPAPVTLAAADAPADRPTGSLQMLLLVVGGALALAGVLASVIYRFAGGRERVHASDRRVNWDQRQDEDDNRAPWHAEPAPRVERLLPVDFDAVRPQPPRVAAFADAIGRIASQARPADIAATEPDETGVEVFDGEFEIETPAPQLAVDSDDEASDHRDAVDDSRASRRSAPALRAERPLVVDFDAVRPEAPQIAAFTDEIRRIALHGRPAAIAEAEPADTEIDYFHGEFEIEGPAPRLAADSHDEALIDHNTDAQQDHPREDDSADIDIITAMLERLASEGPRLTPQPAPEPDLASLEADLAALARSSRGRSAARA
jgi:hypothetical protein